MSGFYILDEHGEPRAVADFLVWAAWFETAGNRVVKQDYAEGEDATCGVSTVFLGLDHNHAGIGPPILWETLVFGTSLDGEMRRYAFYGHLVDALEGFDKVGGWSITFRDDEGQQARLARPVVWRHRRRRAGTDAVRVGLSRPQS